MKISFSLSPLSCVCVYVGGGADLFTEARISFIADRRDASLTNENLPRE